MSGWVRLEAAFGVAVVIFLIGGLAGLVAIWLGLAFVPAAIAVVSPAVAGQLWGLETSLILIAILLALSARMLVVHEWLIVGPAAGPLPEFIMGVGLLGAWGAVLVPFYAAALLSVSSWMSLVIVGMIYASFKSLTSGGMALMHYRQARKLYRPLTFARLPVGEALLIGLLIVAAFGAVVVLVPIVHSAQGAIEAPIRSDLSIVSDQVRASADDLPVLEQVSTERVQIETDGLTRELANLGKGIASTSDVEAARVRLLAAQADALRIVGDARALLVRLRRDEIDLHTKLARAMSAAPALR